MYKTIFAEYRQVTLIQYKILMLIRNGNKKYTKLYSVLEPKRKQLHNQIMGMR